MYIALRFYLSVFLSLSPLIALCRLYLFEYRWYSIEMIICRKWLGNQSHSVVSCFHVIPFVFHFFFVIDDGGKMEKEGYRVLSYNGIPGWIVIYDTFARNIKYWVPNTECHCHFIRKLFNFITVDCWFYQFSLLHLEQFESLFSKNLCFGKFHRAMNIWEKPP